MPRLVLNIVLAGLVLAAVGMRWAIPGDPTQRNYRVLPNMADSVAAEAQAPSAVLPGGMTMQPPPEGSIARDHLPLHYTATPEDAARAGAELRNPFAPEPQHLARGAAVYAAFCQVCHGGGGLGDGPVTRRGVPPPPSLLGENALNVPDGRMFHILTFGQNNMASYAAQIVREDRWKVILHVRALQASARSATQPAPASQP